MFVFNDNKKINKLLNKILAIYSRVIRRIKLKYLLRFREKATLLKYSKFKNVNNLFKKKQMKFNHTSGNQKSNEIINPKISSYSYLLNKSEPIIIKPNKSSKNLAFLMTPCYLLDNDEINFKSINEYNKKFNTNIITGYNSSYPKKEKLFNRTKSYKIIGTKSPFYSIYENNIKYNKSKNIKNPCHKSNSSLLQGSFYPENKKYLFNNRGNFGNGTKIPKLNKKR